MALGAALLPMCHAAGAKLFINRRLDLATRLGADGVHAGGDRSYFCELQRTAPQGYAIGFSAHSRDEAAWALGVGSALTLVSPIFQPLSKDSRIQPHGPEIFAKLPKGSLPFVALGGLTVDRIRPCLEAGASGVAMISTVFAAEDPRAVTQACARVIREFNPTGVSR